MAAREDRPGNRWGFLQVPALVFVTGCVLFLAHGLFSDTAAMGAGQRFGLFGLQFDIPNAVPTDHPSLTPVRTATRTGTPVPTVTGTPPTPTNTPPCAPGGPWQAAQPVPTSVGRHATVQDGKSLYVMGGFAGANDDISNRLFRYDAINDNWSNLAPMPFGVADEAAALYNGRIYVAGGYDGFEPITELQIYDIASNTWTFGPPMPEPNGGEAIAAFSGNIYVAGGGGQGGLPSSTLYVYNIASGTWSIGPPLLSPVFFPGYTQAGQYLYVVGSYGDFPSKDGKRAAGVADHAPYALDRHKLAAPSFNSNVTQRFDMAAGTWSLGPTWTPARTDFGLAFDGVKLYAMGGDMDGGTYFDPSDQVDELAVAGWPGGSWVSSPANLPFGRQGNVSGFFTTTRRGGEIWSTGGLDVGFFPLDEHLYRAAGPCYTPTPTHTPCNPSCTPTSTRTRTFTPTLTPTPCRVAVTGSLDPSDPHQPDRITRDGNASVCGVPKFCPGPIGYGPQAYDAYTYTNTGSSPACVTVALDATGCGGREIESVTYLGSYDPNNLCFNYLADMGNSPSPTGSYSFIVPAGATFVVVVNEIDPNVGCPQYALTISGLVCNTPTPTHTPCSPSCTPTVTRTATYTPTATITPCGPNSGYIYSQTTGDIEPGTFDIGNHCGDCVTFINFPFPYLFYNQPFTSAYVSSKGVLEFLSDSVEWNNTCSATPIFNNAIMAHWDDLRTNAVGGMGIYTSVTGTAPNRVFNIEWRTAYYSKPGSANFEIQLYEGTSRFDLLYGQVDRQGSGATVAVQRDTGSRYTLYECNSGGLTGGLQLIFTQPSCGTSTPTVTGTPPTATNTRTRTHTPTVTPTVCGPTGGIWSQQAQVPMFIADNATAEQDGYIYSFGGTDGVDVVSSAFKYDPLANAWTSIAPLPVPLLAARAVSDGTYIYIVGGFDTNFIETNTLYRYDPATNTYTTLAPFNTPAGASGVAYLNGKIYRIAGYTGVSNNPGAGGVYARVHAAATNDLPQDTSTVEVYTISSNTWAPAAPYPISAGWMSAIPYGNYIYTAGGIADGNYTNKTYRYDPANDTWSDLAIADLPTAMTGPASGFYGGLWILAGGYDFNVRDQVIAWYPAANYWTDLPSLTHARTYAGGAVSAKGFYVIGGYDQNFNPQTDNQRYAGVACGTPTPTRTPCVPSCTPTATRTRTFTPTATATVCGPTGGTWSQQAQVPMSIADNATAEQDGYIYSFGGYNGSFAVADAFKYDPLANTWTSIASLPAPLSGARAASDGTYLYIVGGFDTNFIETNTLYRYDPATNTYTTLAPFNTPAGASGVAYLDGKIYRIAGYTNFSGKRGASVYPKGQTGTHNELPQDTNTVEVYTISSNTWAPAAPYPLSASFLSAVAYGNYVYTAGGSRAGSYTNKTYRYDPANNTWSDPDIADLPAPVAAAASGFYGGLWIIAGGYDSNVRNQVKAWYPGANYWTDLPSLPQPAAYAGGAVIAQGFHVVAGFDQNINPQSANQRYVGVACGTPTPTRTPCGPSCTPSPTRTFTPTSTVTRTSTPSNTLTRTPTSTSTPPNTSTPTFTDTRTGTPEPTNTATAARTTTHTPTLIATACPMSFRDVGTTDYFYEAVRYLYCRRVISGYGDGTFKPYNNTTRGQLAKIVVLAEGWTIYTPPTPTFRDVSTTDPFYAVVETAYHQAIISGYDCGAGCLEYRPGNNITRAQLCKIVVLAEEWPLYTPPTPTFRDVPRGDTFYSYIETAYRHGIISGYNCGGDCLEFRPGNNATRGQICVIVYRAITAP